MPSNFVQCVFYPLIFFEFSLTHLPVDKMATILANDNFKCIFFNENDRIPIRISLKLVHRSVVNQHRFRTSGNGMVPNRWEAITWTNADPFHWHIYAALGGDELTDDVEWCMHISISKVYCHRFRKCLGATKVPDPMMVCCWLDPCKHISMKFQTS